MKKIPLITILLFVPTVCLVGAYVWFYSADQSMLANTLRMRAVLVGANARGAASLDTEQDGDSLAAARAYIVSEEKVAAFLSDLEARGRAAGATVAVSSVEPDKNASGTLGIALSISGSFASVMQALGLIEYAPYGISASTVTVQKESGTLWRAEVKGGVLYAPASATKK